MQRFSDVYTNFRRHRLTTAEASQLLGISERQFLRWRNRFDEEGQDGLQNRRLGRPNVRRADLRESRLVQELYQKRYQGFSVAHFHHFLTWEHGLNRSYSWVKNRLVEVGLVKVHKQGGAHRLRRPRAPRSGMMLHQDGSQHAWFGAERPMCDLIVTMDDATSEITSAFFCEQEGTLSSLHGLKETIESHGIPASLYTDRGSHYFYTPEAGGKIDKTRLTQFGRACKKLRIKHIGAYSPEARGRSERMFKTLQGRLPKELLLEKATNIKDANNYLKETYLPRHNALFTKKPEDMETAFLTPKGIDMESILCIKNERTGAKDNTVSYNGKIIQIHPNIARNHFVKCEVEVREHLNGHISIHYGHLEIARQKE